MIRVLGLVVALLLAAPGAAYAEQAGDGGVVSRQAQSAFLNHRAKPLAGKEPTGAAPAKPSFGSIVAGNRPW